MIRRSAALSPHPLRAPGSLRSCRSGFSLIELLIVVTILAIMIVVGIQMNELLGPENSLASTTAGIAAAISDARSDAIVCGRVVWFEFALGEKRDARQFFRSIRDPLPGREKDAEEEEFLLTVSDWQEIPGDVRIESVAIGEQEAATVGTVSVPIRPDGTLPSFLVRLWAPELDPDLQRQAGWSAVQVAGLLGQPRVVNRFIEPEFLREDAFQ